MVILGIDPGLADVGWGVVRKANSTLSCVAYGCIKTSKHTQHIERLMEIHHKMLELIERFSPDMMSVEELFFHKNSKTALKVGEARGVILMTASMRGIKVSECTPLQVKQAVASYGRAEKVQVQKMVKTLLGLSDIPRPDDAADALAIAITGAQYAHEYQ